MVIFDFLAISTRAGWSRRVGEPVSVQNDLWRERKHISGLWSTGRRGSDVHALIHGPGFLTIIKDFLVPVITLVPPILDHLDLPRLAQRLKNPDVVSVGNTYQADLALVLQLHQRMPGFEGLLDCGQRGVKEVAVEIGRVQVGERLLEGALDLG